ncbi:hypothetical protein QUB10_03565 [Microcoleus sp. B5-D4]|uniref:hypothetical protein n=1 Tax=unclassified Microcoleus TaxID=2642155 RepID=UPI002FD4F8A7
MPTDRPGMCDRTHRQTLLSSPIAKLMQQFIQTRRSDNTPHLFFEGDLKRQLPGMPPKQGSLRCPTDCIR